MNKKKLQKNFTKKFSLFFLVFFIIPTFSFSIKNAFAQDYNLYFECKCPAAPEKNISMNFSQKDFADWGTNVAGFAQFKCLGQCGSPSYEVETLELIPIDKSEETTSLCTKTIKCPEGYSCTQVEGAAAGRCIKEGKEKGCTSQAECGEGWICFNNVCVPGKKPDELGDACSDDAVCEKTVGKGSVCDKISPGAKTVLGGRCTKLPKGETTNIECEVDSDCVKAFNNAGASCEGVKRERDGTLLEKGRCTNGTEISQLDGYYQPAGTAELENPLGDIDLLNLVGKRIIPGLLGVIGAVAVVAIVWGGFTYVISRGNEEMTKEARAIITYAIIGLLLAIISWIIINTVVVILMGE
ncbi:MAG: pilin [Patescibacteria group bacterium]